MAIPGQQLRQTPIRATPVVYLPAQRPTAARIVFVRLRGLLLIGSIVVVGLLADDWVASVAVAVLFVGIRFLLRQQGPPIVAAAFGNQWLQVTAGVAYLALTGRRVAEMSAPMYRPMMLMGLASIAALFAGFYLASGFRRLSLGADRRRATVPWSTNQIAVAYIIVIGISGALTEVAWSIPGLTQAILVFSHVRYVLLYLLLTRLSRPTPRWGWTLLLVGLELILGFAGFFADFRVPLVIAAIALLGTVNRRGAKTWMAVGAFGLMGITAAILWTAIKPIVRSNFSESATTMERLNAVAEATKMSLSRQSDIWKLEADNLVSRVWAVYYASLALARVPSVLPHENGAILKGAISNVLTPRAFFPDKPVLPSQSEEVRKYAGVWVRGREYNTSYAFGYVGESYVDFGFPLMLLPVFVFGVLLGTLYRLIFRNIQHGELRIGVLVVIAWSTLSPYETSWVMMIGPSIMTMMVLGGLGIFVDRMLVGAEGTTSRPGRRTPVKPWSPDVPMSADV